MNSNRISPQTVAELVAYASKGLAGTMYTDRELFEKMNTQLPENLKVCYRTFQRYKAAALHDGGDKQEGKFSTVYADLHQQMVLAGMQQKDNLLRMLLEAEGNKWQRYRWLLEKKFPEFNQGCIMENFRRENSYQDEDYPMFHQRKQQPVTIQEVPEEEPLQITPIPEQQTEESVQARVTNEPVAKAISDLVPNSKTLQTPRVSHLPKTMMPNQRKRVPSVKDLI